MMMKKPRLITWLALLLTAALLLGLAACGKEKDNDDPTKGETTAGELTLDAAADPGAWRIEVRGISGVDAFDSADAQWLPKVEVEMTTTNSSGFTVTNTYGGVLLRSVLDYFGVQFVAGVTVISMDGNEVTYTHDTAMAADTLLAWEMDGSPIDAQPPLRMCPASGTPEMVVKLVSAINVRPRTAEQTTTEAHTTTQSTQCPYVDYTIPPNFFDPPPDFPSVTTTTAAPSASVIASTDPTEPSSTEAPTEAPTGSTKRPTVSYKGPNG